ncbi:cyclopropane-fatty-acyl-phospholipid synthase family protein [Caulobacter sp. 17J80-11]|uniref:SAM-dependent methyltransferase n=1 Tax=Caulobacter sp. 17J80-11 TaxID=2763502 RepID=UPI001653D7B5|nr:cyclopropane-fatty-acyl-phospholipid synthase family protein [Caulobacter sp. 17J80-11]MBC6980867.1 class I SAM-dependent methyltransferase [Caulobacter sp. 17J80-11]
MSEVLQSHASPVWTLPEVRNAPALFRNFLKLATRHWRVGEIVFVIPEGRRLSVRGEIPGPTGELVVRDYRFVGRVMAAGDIGFAEGFMAGEWETPNLSALLEVVGRNWERMGSLVSGNPLVQAVNLVSHALRRNSRRGSRRNIYAHYDLGNAFYERWLDPTMTYSSAKYEHPGQPLSEAQRAKYRALAEAMQLKPDQHVLEIGCGWGGFAEFAASEIGAKVTGITISEAQYEYARKRLFQQGLSERTEFRLMDYRDVDGVYDRVASIEMFEAVGERYWPAYFDKVREVLKPDGRAGLQIITIRDDLFDAYRRRMDFIQKYIFPGGALPSEQRLQEETRRAGLETGAISRFGQAYADTLEEWAHRFEGAWRDITALGFDERFRRLWRFYLSYCEAGFRTGRTDVVQLELKRA